MNIGHNSVQIPHDGRFQGQKTHKGASFKKARFTTFFRGTTMSQAMAAAGLIPDVHLVQEASNTGILRRSIPVRPQVMSRPRSSTG